MRGHFRLGTTSYIIESGLADNLLWLARRPGGCRISEMQLVLFDTPEISNIPSLEEAALLASIAADHDMAFTVHLPCNIMLGDADPSVRRASAALFKRVVEATSRLEPICWTLHIPMPGNEETRRYLDRTTETLAPLIGELRSPRELAIENIYPIFEIEPPIIEELDTSVCIDIGHLLFFGLDVWSFLDRWLPRCRNIHIHGCTPERDHESLAQLPRGFLQKLFGRISGEPCLRTVTMEIFGISDFESSISTLLNYLRPF
ncbi:MAG: TIM barrel protein [Synergistaceae bacterium]|jgi:sugar phosphate isomerase/epimerase|nr:TIM barrel protein [Synergistaceae bacterium]